MTVKKSQFKVLAFVFSIILLSFVISGKIIAIENYKINVEVFGKTIDFKGQEPFIDKNYRTMVPIRFISEALDKNVYWNSSKNEVKIKDLKNEIILIIDKNYGYINGKRIFYDTNPIIINNRTYVPIRFISEVLGYNVDWIQDTRTVVIDNNHKDYYLDKENKIIQKPIYISHAGGRIKNETYTNTKEALEISLDKGLNYIEVDISKTYDNKYVLLHGWSYIARFFPDSEKRWYSYDEFLNLKMINNWTQMSLEDVVIWLLSNEGVYIITDTKDNNIEMLSYISRRYKSILPRVIPQIYSIDEYDEVKALGFSNIIFTLYRINDSDEKILKDVLTKDLFAVTMPIERVKSGLAKKLDKYNIFTYSHTINNIKTVNELKDLGVDGFYTDDLY